MNFTLVIGQVNYKIDSTSITCLVLPKAEIPGSEDSSFSFLAKNLKWLHPEFCG